MKSLPISTFKAQALQLIEEVEQTREGLIITKRGRAVAQVLPFPGIEEVPVPGKLAHTLLFESDIVSPLGEEDWEVAR